MTQLNAAGNARTVKSTFSRQTSVSLLINADPTIVWAILTHAADYARWNSTIIGIEGKIAPNEKIALKSTLDPKRVFKLAIKEFDVNQRLVWGDAMGKRIFILKKTAENQTEFSMNEKIGGPLFPLFAKMIPPFDDAFNQFASDLKTEAEKIQNIAQ